MLHSAHVHSFLPLRTYTPALLGAHLNPHLSVHTGFLAKLRIAFASVACRPGIFKLPVRTPLFYARVLSFRYIHLVEILNHQNSWAEAPHTRFFSQIILCRITLNLLLFTALKRPCSLIPPLSFRALPNPMARARVRAHQPAERSGLMQTGEILWLRRDTRT